MLASNRLRVYIQANIHAGEVEGKEAVLALVRDIARGQHADWLRLDGAAGQSQLQRRRQREGHADQPRLPARPVGGQGTRPNAQGLNINRDDIKLETPEARSMVRLLNDFDPHVMIDLHTTNGSRHAYHLTYETPNNPAVDGAIVSPDAGVDGSGVEGDQEAGRLGLPLLRQRVGQGAGPGLDARWRICRATPTTTGAMRNRFGILSETYSYLPFRDRVITNRRFLEEVLGYAHANAARLKATPRQPTQASLVGQRVSLRSRPARAAERVEILMGGVEEEVNPYSGRIMHRRLDVRRPEQMWEEAAFETTETERVPTAYFVPAEQKASRSSGCARTASSLERVERAATLPLEEFRDRATETTPKPFENHQERTVTGQYVAVEREVPVGRLSRADDPAPGAAGLLPARAALQRRPGDLERPR